MRFQTVGHEPPANDRLGQVLVNLTNQPLLEASRLGCARESSACLRDISFAVEHGSFNVLAGDAGCGKNLLLRVLGLLEKPDCGELFVEGSATSALNDEARAGMRNVRFGYVFAAPFLLTAFTAIENVAMPLFRISHADPGSARVRGEELLQFVGLAAAAQVPVGKLKLDEQRRVSLARSLVNEPSALFIEDLDALFAGDASQQFSSLLRRICTRFSTTIVATASAGFPVGKDDRKIDLLMGTIARDSRHAEKSDA